MRNFLILLVAVLIFTACGNSHRRNENKPKEISDSSTKVIPIVTPIRDSFPEEKFYAEMFNKKELRFESWKDSIIETYEGEGQNPYKLPVKIQHGNTQSFLFIIITSYEYYEKEDWERKGFEIQFKLRGTPAEGKTLKEDKMNRELYEWKYLAQHLADSLKELLPEPIYPKKIIHK